MDQRFDCLHLEKEAHTLTFFWRQLRQANSGSPRSEVLRADVLAVSDRVLFDLGGVLEGFDVPLGDIGTYGSVWGIIGFGKTSGPGGYPMWEVQPGNFGSTMMEGHKSFNCPYPSVL